MVNSTRPMDRLICGDVGFGKTEVAMRAIYRAVLSGKQVSTGTIRKYWKNFE
jgi:transcription-repair coupling factor (superfamily II helicase)